MKRWVWQPVLVLVGILLLVLAGAAGRPLGAQGPCDRYVVAPGGSDSGDCSSELSPCLTVQYALGNASSGDAVCVADNIDGDPRPFGPAPDVGADEYVAVRLYLPLLLRGSAP